MGMDVEAGEEVDWARWRRLRAARGVGSVWRTEGRAGRERGGRVRARAGAQVPLCASAPKRNTFCTEIYEANLCVRLALKLCSRLLPKLYSSL